MVRLLAPILAFTGEEIWAAMPHAKDDDAESVLFNDIPEVNPAYSFSEEQQAYWEKILALKADVNKALEERPRRQGGQEGPPTPDSPSTSTTRPGRALRA